MARNDTSGDWGVITGPLPYQWGGTWLGAMKDSPNMDLAKEFIKFVDPGRGEPDQLGDRRLHQRVPEGHRSRTWLPDQKQAPGDFVSSQVVVEKITAILRQF